MQFLGHIALDDAPRAVPEGRCGHSFPLPHCPKWARHRLATPPKWPRSLAAPDVGTHRSRLSGPTPRRPSHLG